MGLYDNIQIEHEVELPDLDDPPRGGWQTKSFDEPCMRTYKITNDGRLLKEQIETEIVPEEERPEYDESIEGFETDMDRWFGMLERETVGWDDTEFHGIMTFYRSLTVEGNEPSLFQSGQEREWFEYQAKFTDGILESIKRLD